MLADIIAHVLQKQHFSDWVQIFSSGVGQVIISDSVTNQVLVSVERPLTPGPLVVALVASPASQGPTHYWPPVDSSIETIAASYPTAKPGTAHVRLVNLAPNNLPTGGDTAGFKTGAKSLAQSVNYAGASAWIPTLPTSQTFDVSASVD